MMDDLVRREDVYNTLSNWMYDRTDNRTLNEVVRIIPSAQPETNCSEFPNNSDLISRQAAIKSVTQEYNRRRTGDGLKLAWIEKAINETPAAQPEIEKDGDTISRAKAIEVLARMMPRSYTPDGSHPADEEIFKAQEIYVDCIETLEILPSAQPKTNYSEISNGSDTISRREAIDAVLKLTYADEAYGYADAKDLVDSLEKLPSAQPERKTGRWIYEETQYKISSYRCSECGRHVLYETKSDVCEAYPYCHCGAKMVKINEVYANEWLGL